MEEDDDVVYEGSAIYEHLQSTGFTDFDHVRSNYAAETSTLIDNASIKMNNSQALLWRLMSKLSLFCDTSHFKTKDLQGFRHKVCNEITNSGLLNEDDKLVLGHFSPLVSQKYAQDKEEKYNYSQHDHSSNTNTGYITQWLLKFCWISLSLSIFLGAIFLDEGQPNDQSTRRLQLIMVGCIALTSLIILRIKDRLEQPYKKVYSQLAVELYRLKHLSQTSSKAVRLLMEIHLISRGFVLAIGSNSFNTGGTKEENPHCIAVRKALQSTMISASIYLNTIHQTINHNKCNNYQYICIKGIFDDIESLDCSQPFSSSINYNKQSESKVVSTLGQLKVYKDVFKLQTSAVLTQILFHLESSDTFCDKLINKFSEMFPSDYIESLDNNIKHFEQHLSFIEKCWLQIDKPSDNNKLNGDKKDDIYVAIHSLNLHLQAAMFKLHDLEKHFEQQPIINKTNCSTKIHNEDKLFLPYQHVNEQLNLIRAEIDSSLGCWEEAVDRVDHKYNNNPTTTTSSKVNHVDIIEGEQITKTNSDPIPLLELKDPIIMDEVFEAFIDEEYSSLTNEDEDNDDDLTSHQLSEHKKLKEQKKQGRRVLNELQPILNKRRKLWEKREQIAMRRMNPLMNHLQENEVCNAPNSPIMTCSTESYTPGTEATLLQDCNNVAIVDKDALNLSNEQIYYKNIDLVVLAELDSREPEIPIVQISETFCDKLSITGICNPNPTPENTSQESSITIIPTNDKNNSNEVNEYIGINEPYITNQHEEEYDSDEERIKLFQRVKKELEEDERGRIKQELDHDKRGIVKRELDDETQHENGTEYDSDEERLRNYNKMKKLLYSENDENDLKCSPESLYTTDSPCDSDEERLNNYKKVKSSYDDIQNIINTKSINLDNNVYNISSSISNYNETDNLNNQFDHCKVHGSSSTKSQYLSDNVIKLNDIRLNNCRPNTFMVQNSKYDGDKHVIITNSEDKDLLTNNEEKDLLTNNEDKGLLTSSEHTKLLFSSNCSDITLPSSVDSKIDIQNVSVINDFTEVDNCLGVYKSKYMINQKSLSRIKTTKDCLSNSNALQQSCVNTDKAAIFSTGDDDVSDAEEPLVKAEVFSTEDNASSDEEESRALDWSKVTLSSHPSDTLKDRLSLFSGGPELLSFHAQVAAQAIAASQNRGVESFQTEETFGGIGEAEVL